MRMLRLCAYFAPEKTASSHFYDDAYKAYAEARIDCVCITPEPCRGISDEVRREYKNKRTETLYDGYITVKRFPMIKEGRNPVQRAFRYLLCSIKTYRQAIKEKDIDVIFVGSTPPTMGAVAAKVAKRLSKKYGRKVPVIYNLQDIFPDSLVTAGLAKKDGLLWKIGRKLENYTYRNAEKIIVISEGFKRNIVEKGVEESKIEVISNWINTEETVPVSRQNNTIFDEFSLEREKFWVVYAGNFGEVQGADVVLDAAELLSDNADIRFAIFGGGSKFADARERAKDMKNVFIHDLLPLDRVSEVYSMGDVSLITCKKGAGKSAMPSKTWSIMACNTPIIASFDTDSDLADVINDAGAGACVEPSDPKALAYAIIAEKNKNKPYSGDLRNYVKNVASKDVCLSKYIKIFKSI
ncbi:MAG: glycosyltransferase family 4 protein [Clostridia bacterium]|nr:glycosyltransferase family 4 protein [Clostridia bacterium]